MRLCTVLYVLYRAFLWLVVRPIRSRKQNIVVLPWYWNMVIKPIVLLDLKYFPQKFVSASTKSPIFLRLKEMLKVLLQKSSQSSSKKTVIPPTDIRPCYIYSYWIYIDFMLAHSRFHAPHTYFHIYSQISASLNMMMMVATS